MVRCAALPSSANLARISETVSGIGSSSGMSIVQVKDGGEGDDSFPSWGLKVEGDRETTPIFRQSYDKSHWLGRALAKSAQVDFFEALRE